MLRGLLGRFDFIGLFVLVGIFSALIPFSFTSTNLRNILIQAGTNAVIAAGMTFVILSADIDLSVGSVLALLPWLGRPTSPTAVPSRLALGSCLAWALSVAL